MRTPILRSTRSAAFLACCSVWICHIQAQTTISWNGYTTNQISPYVFNTGTAPNNMRAIVTTNNCTRGDNTPKYVTPGNSATSGTPCYISGLALQANTFSSYVAGQNSNFTLTMLFNPENAQGNDGTCNSATFSIRDINSDESFDSFLDVVEISAVDGNGVPIPTANITTVLATRVTRVNSGAIVRLVGHNNSSETIGSYNGGAICGDTQISITPSTDALLGSITIKYRPAYGTTTSNAYYNINPRPAMQYVSISNITLTPHVTPSACSVLLPVELLYFRGTSIGRSNLLEWKTATERDNSHFDLERSTNGKEWERITTLSGAGTTMQPQYYRAHDEGFTQTLNYYRLRQVDDDGTEKLSDVIFVDNSLRTKTLVRVVNTMGQEVDENYRGMKIYVYSDGSTIRRVELTDSQ